MTAIIIWNLLLTIIIGWLLYAVISMLITMRIVLDASSKLLDAVVRVDR